MGLFKFRSHKLTFLCHLLNLIHLVKGPGPLPDRDQEVYLRNNDQPKCGLLIDTNDKKSRSRIINGQPSALIYPWMARVVAKRNRKVEATNNPNQFLKIEATLTSTGSFITKTVLLTCGHCICDGPYDSGTLVACKLDSSGNEENQNWQQNHISILLDPIPTLSSSTPKWDPRVGAFLYKYEPTPTHFSKNGDIGCVILSKDILQATFTPVITSAIVPICLPVSTSFPVKKIKVKTTGWGKRYDEVKTNINYRTSCQTTETVEKQSSQFLPCKDQILNGRRFCSQWPKEFF